MIFHVNLSGPLNVGDHVGYGTVLGTHFGSQTLSDISVFANDASNQRRMVSYFDVMAEEIFLEFIQFRIQWNAWTIAGGSISLADTPIES
jgi:hypothetical protein